jgi:hypothetical protein
MATLSELQTMLNDPGLRDKVRAAVVVTAKNVNFESDATPNHAARLVWAKQALSDPNGTAEKVVRYVVAANNTLTLNEITGLSDSAIQSHVDAAVNVFA